MGSSYNSAAVGAAAGIGIIGWILSLAISVFFIICQWKIFVKAGKPGWAAIVPIYNLYVLFEIIYGNGIKFLFLLIPLFNCVVAILYSVRLGQVFGKDTGFILGLIFLPVIFMPMLAFGNSYYNGPTQATI